MEELKPTISSDCPESKNEISSETRQLLRGKLLQVT